MVIVVATLAAVSVPMYTSHVRSQKILESYATMGIIRIAQENFRAGNAAGCYRSLPANPATVPAKRAVNFDDDANWNATGLNILASLDRQSRFRYRVYAGGGGAGCNEAIPDFGACVADTELDDWFNPALPWYIITAEANMDNDGATANTFVVTAKSRSNFLVCNEGQ